MGLNYSKQVKAPIEETKDYPNGEKYEGFWRNNKKDGEGVYY